MEPKERIIFDDNAYPPTAAGIAATRKDEAEFLLDYFAGDLDLGDIDDIPPEQWGDYVALISDEQILGYMNSRRYNDWAFEADLLRETLGSGEREGMPLVVKDDGKGALPDFSVLDDIDALLNTLSSGPLKLWDENGHLYIEGAGGNGNVKLEVKVLTDVGRDAYDDLMDTDGLTPAQEASGVRDLFDDERFSELPRHAEFAWNAPAEEWDDSLAEKPGAALGEEDIRDLRDAGDALANDKGEPSRPPMGLDAL